MSFKYKISVVSPVYQGEFLVEELVRRIESSLVNITDSYEIILVDDYSRDHSWKKITEISQKNSKVKGIKLSKNFGQHPAILAGLKNVSGEWIVVMDCDLQDRPEEIPKLFNEVNKGFDLAIALRINRQDSYFKKLFSKLFVKILSYLTGNKHDEKIANFGIYSHKVITAVNSLPEYQRCFPVMVQWVGFNKTLVNVVHGKREIGKSNYDFKRKVKLATQIALSFSEKPLYLTIKMGFIISALAFILGIVYIIRALTMGTPVQGWYSIILSIWFFSGLIIGVLGIIGLYIGKTFEQVRNRPVYLVDQKTNFEE